MNSGKYQVVAIVSGASGEPVSALLYPSEEAEMKRMIAAAAASFIAGSLATATSAEQLPSKEPTIVEQIPYSDLDLSTATGQKHLEERIRFAAYRLCLSVSSATPSPAAADPGCSRGVMNEGLAQMERAVARTNSGHALAQAITSRR